MSYDARRWADCFLGDLASRKSQGKFPLAEEFEPHLSPKSPPASPIASRIALFLDYDGTAAEIVNDPPPPPPRPNSPPSSRVSPPNPAVDTCIISGRKPG